ncbi:hypothetical protein MRB53_013164 [Persea americana]|uniref:Uncharacterized protein n=1 Tax=Persea americana TaxID=3435 RepID=A0ACC2K7T6_PERAE|nr:hypothetical protein MRB53_013164 [Persea americana]
MVQISFTKKGRSDTSVSPASFLCNTSDASVAFRKPHLLPSSSYSLQSSPKSPFYNASESLFDRASRAIHLSNSRADHFISSTSTATHKDMSSTLVPNSPRGLYLMSISLGTPSLEILADADTGSHLIWTQCLPCESCYEQVAPLFDPLKSSTYRDFSCNSSMCKKVCNLGYSKNSTCKYQIFYADRSYSTGVLSAEMLVMNSSCKGSVNFPNITFGCGYDNRGFDHLTTSVVGLGHGPLSLISIAPSEHYPPTHLYKQFHTLSVRNEKRR